MKITSTLLILAGVLIMTSCSDDPEFIEPPSSGSTLDAEVGGETQPNQVYVDFSSDNQSPVQRRNWDLGFYTGSDYVVTLNSSNGMLAYELDKTILQDVTEEDTVGLGAQLSLDAIFGALFAPVVPPFVSESINWADDPTGDLNNTAITKIDNTDQNVYIINRGKAADGSELGWLKIKVTQDAGSYRLEYAEISSQATELVSVPKDENLNFVYYSFDSGFANVEPGKMEWDIAFTTYIDILPFGQVTLPYAVKDWVIQNRNAESAEVVIDAGEDILDRFDSFALADIGSLDFDDEINAVGGNWRTVASPTPGSVTGVKDDRFYVVKDPDGNYYKFIFTKMLNNTGERGFPQVSYSLLQ